MVMKTTFRNYSAIVMLGLATSALGACSTTSTKVAAHAPIEYKIDQSKIKMASIRAPYGRMTSARPYVSPRSHVSRPQTHPVSPQATQPYQAPYLAPRVQMPARPVTPDFDQSKVDTHLYAHQKVGKPYTVLGKKYTPKHNPHYDEKGKASWYGPKFHGKLTANGEIYNMDGLTAAHKTLPLNSMVMVTNLATGQSVKVRINDRGPFVDNRIIDLSRAAAKALGLLETGLAEVRVQYAGPADPNLVAPKFAPQKPVPAQPVPAQPVPVKPVPAPQPEPENEDMVAEIPEYQSLRDLDGAGAPTPEHSAAPQAQEQGRPSAPSLTIEQPSVVPATPSEPEQVESETPPEDGPVTLTIKGPIHMASSTSDDANQARFIPAVNYRDIDGNTK